MFFSLRAHTCTTQSPSWFAESNDAMAWGYYARIACMSLCPGFAKCQEAKGILLLIKAGRGNEVWGGYESQVWSQNILILELPESLPASLSSGMTTEKTSISYVAQNQPSFPY